MLCGVLSILGYVPEDDSWDTDGRRTYSIDEDASRAWLTSLGKILKRHGYDRDKTNLRMFRHFATGEAIEIEPGGSGVIAGHLLHHMKAEVVQ